MVGIVGVVIAAALVAVVATRTSQGDASPKRTYALVFGIIAVYVVILFLFQSRDLSRAEGADAAALALDAGPMRLADALEA